MSYTIQVRRDSAANWTSVNPVLHSGELGLENDTRLAKMGDGVTTWTSLPYWLPDPYSLAVAGGAMIGWLSPAVVRLTDAATILVDAALGNDFRVTIAASRIMATPSNPQDGQLIMFDITQGTGGNYSVTWASGYAFGSGTAPTLSTAAGATDLAGFKYNADKAKWLCTGTVTGF